MFRGSRSFNFLWGLALFSLTAVQCTGPTRPEAQTTSQGPTPSPVELVYLSSLESSVNRQVDMELIQRFETAHPNLKVNRHSSQMITPDLEQLLGPQVLTPPDVMTLSAGTPLVDAVKQGWVLDISELWDHQGWNKSYLQAVQDLSTVDGKQYYLPIGSLWWGFFYNRQLFDQYNLHPPQTWEDFLVICQIFKEKGITPVVLDSTYRGLSLALWFDYLDLRLNGPDFHRSLMRGQERLNGPEVQHIFQTLKELLDAGYLFNPVAAGLEGNMLTDRLANGQAAMALVNPADLEAIAKPARDNFESFQFPSFDSTIPQVQVVWTLGYLASARSQQAEGASAFLTYLGSAEAQTYLLENLQGTPNILPASTNVDLKRLSPEVQRELQFIQEADDLSEFFLVNTTPTLAGKGMETLYGFLKEPNNLDNLLEAWEKARQEEFGK